ncbi:hypothetical protein EWB00_008627 [Schistosoma japonicum]|uniref:Uncharacterized protein n=1 Tax=Schistosoma japonicum TaxID=6182 RepID=A0A4Z2CPC4_SCHJA|nr:hypothetical protein EWB00_008617 [Schistosoma japonicum]TNN06097.1 hypothetical protein EWB00_008627 [Schistosoma japonicum]
MAADKPTTLYNHRLDSHLPARLIRTVSSHLWLVCESCDIHTCIAATYCHCGTTEAQSSVHIDILLIGATLAHLRPTQLYMTSILITVRSNHPTPTNNFRQTHTHRCTH